MGKELDAIDLHVGARIHLRRTLMGMTQEQLAEAIGVSFQQVQKYERGYNRLSASRMFDVCQALGVPVTYLFEDLPEHVVGRSRSQGASPSQPGAADLLSRTESMQLLRSYWHMPEQQRQKVRALIDMLAKSSR